jgi:hypothetical protein
MQFLVAQAQTKSAKITITSPKAAPQRTTSDSVVNLRFTVADPDIVMVVIKVTTEAEGNSARFPITPGTTDYRQSVPLFTGVNTIEVFGFKRAGAEKFIQDKAAKASVKIECDEDCVPGRLPMPIGAVAVNPPAASGDVIISPIAGAEGVKDVPSVDSNIVVQKKSGIKKLVIEVRNNGQRVDQKDLVEVKDLTETLGLATTKLKVAAGTNLIRVFDANTLTSQASAEVVCTGKCGKTETEAGAVTDKPAANITILKPTGEKATNGLVESSIRVIESDIRNVYLQVTHDEKPIEQPKDVFKVEYKDGVAVLNPNIRLAKGENKILVYNPNQPADKADQASVTVICEGDKCDAPAAVGTNAGKIVIDLPDDARFVDATYITPNLKVTDAAIKNVYVSVTNNDRPIPQVPEIFPVKDGKDNPIKIRIGPDKNIVKITEDATTENRAQALVVVYCDGPNCGKGSDIETEATPFTRAIVGLEQAAAASANPEQKLFLEFNLTAPLFKRGENPMESPLWLWLNPRITSLPQQTAGSVAEFSTAAGFFAPFTSGKVNDIVQGFEFAGGFEVPIKFPNNKSRVTGAIASGFGPDSKVRFGVSALIGAGVSAPFSSQKSVQVFKVNESVIDRFPDAAGKEFIALVAGDRNRFFRQYFVGLRLKSYYVKANHIDELDAIFPGILDVTFGQNESVTGGELHGGVVKIEGIYPLPFIKGGKRGSFYVFGSALMKLSRPKTVAPIFLQLPDATVTFPAPNVFIQQVPTRDSDHYRLGVGVDLIRLLKRNQ